MTARRPVGTGSVRARGPGKWQMRVTLGINPVTNRPIQRAKTINASTKREALVALAAFVPEAMKAAGIEVVGAKHTVAEVLDEFMKHSRSRGNAERTMDEHEREADVMKKEIGDLDVRQLTPRHIDELWRRLGDGSAGRSKNGQGISPSSIQRYSAVLSAALEQAIKWDWLETNPTKKATTPKVIKTELVVPNRPDINKLVLDARAKDERMGMILALAALTGMRRGELCGLHWEDVGETGLYVRRSVYRKNRQDFEKSTKSGKARFVALAPIGIALIRAWRAQCEKWATDAGEDPQRLVYVVSPEPDGKRPMNVDKVTDFVSALAKANGMPTHLHSFRHFVVTESLHSGSSPRDVADFVGHSDTKLTLQLYSHATDPRQQALAAELAEGLLGPMPELVSG